MNNYFIIKPGGVLKNIYWDSNKEEHVESQDISNNMYYYLQDECYLDDNVTLKDIFILLQKNMELSKIIINNHIEDFITEAFINEKPYNKDEIEYLELSKSVDWDDASSLIYCHFSGVGFKLKEDHDGLKKGSRQKYCIGLSPINHYINFPVKLNTEILLIDFPYKDLISLRNEYNSHMYTLFDILYYPIYEISFYGPPKERDNFIKKVNNNMKEIDEELKNAK
ncbi:MAG: hypothetical protein ACOC33_00620 [bacterium]